MANNSFVVSRAHIAYALCLPLAVVLGYFLADPTASGSMVAIMMVLAGLCLPVLLRWHHPLLILCWNAALQPFFLPGQPFLWMPLALLGFGFTVLSRFTSPDARSIYVPSLVRPLLFLLTAVVVTSWIRGGLGLRVFGSSSFGGKSYLGLIAAILGYFALASQRIPARRAKLFASLFFFSALTALIPNLAVLMGSGTDFLFYLFPAGYAMEQAGAEYGFNPEIVRIGGLTVASNAMLCWLLLRYGYSGVFDWMKPWRFVFFILALAGSAFCGFRNTLILSGLILVLQFYFEGLCTGRVLTGVTALLLVLGTILVPNGDKLPMVVQRTLSFLPIRVSPAAKLVGENSTEWRLKIWKEALPDVPRYFFAGKGYAIDPIELRFAYDNAMRKFRSDTEWAAATGSYHNGPLTVIIPLGVWGAIAFGWFVFASLRYLYRNYSHGDPALHRINTLLLTFFIARVVLFLFVFGSFAEELFQFTGLMGLSVSLNGPALPEPSPVPSNAESEELAYTEHFAPGNLGVPVPPA